MGKSKVNLYSIANSSRQIERIGSALKLLDLDGMRSSFDQIAQEMIKRNATYYDFLESLLEKELSYKEDNRQQRWIQQARFPWIKTLAEFDFSFQPKLNKRLIYELASCRYIDKAENIIFLGAPGVGKTHLSIALGIEAIQKGYEVRFLTLAQLIESADKTEGDGLLRHRLLGSLLRSRILILDEMDLHDTTTISSTFLFKLLQDRYEKGSIIFTSNKAFTEWGALFENETRAEAAIDRIVHHAVIIHIEGDSYRIKDRLKDSKSLG